MSFDFSSVEKILNYEFKNKNILLECFTHASYSNEHKSFKNYERLEFLGDSVLGFVVSDYLFRYNNFDEGDMTGFKQKVVSTKPLSMATKNLDIQKFLLREENVVITDKMCENLFEAIIGAIYLDGGLEVAKRFIMDNIVFSKLNSLSEQIDYKTKLNELTSKQKIGAIKYVVIDKIGQDHEPIFVVQALLNNKVISQGSGKTKKSAEQNAAESAYKILIKDGKN